MIKAVICSFGLPAGQLGKCFPPARESFQANRQWHNTGMRRGPRLRGGVEGTCRARNWVTWDQEYKTEIYRKQGFDTPVSHELAYSKSLQNKQ